MKNYHTHTYRCHHASGDVKDYAAQAINQGAKVLGMSDHVPFPDGRWKSARMDYEEIPSYFQAIKEARILYPRLRILQAFECEWVPEYRSFYIEELLGNLGCHYLVGANHYIKIAGSWEDVSDAETPAHLRSYADNLIGAMESGLFLFIAHPDHFMVGYGRWDKNAQACTRDILEAAKATGSVLEINGYGFRKKPRKARLHGPRMYPVEEFWQQAAELDIKVTWNSDAHKPEDVLANLEDCRSVAERYNLIPADLDPEAEAEDIIKDTLTV